MVSTNLALAVPMEELIKLLIGHMLVSCFIAVLSLFVLYLYRFFFFYMIYFMLSLVFLLFCTDNLLLVLQMSLSGSCQGINKV